MAGEKCPRLNCQQSLFLTSMISQFVEQRFNLSTWKVNRLTQFLLLAVTMLTYSIMAMNIANSLFLSNAGAEYLPLSFIFLGLFSTLAYGGVSQIVDRFSRVMQAIVGFLYCRGLTHH